MHSTFAAASPTPSIANGLLVATPRPARADATSPSPLVATRRLSKNQELFVEGDQAKFFYKVASGAVRTYKLLDDGRRQIDAFHLPGDIFGFELCAEHRFSAEAVGHLMVTTYRRCLLEDASRRNSDLVPQIIAAIMRSLERAQNHMLLLGRKSAPEKIATFLLDLAARMPKDGLLNLPMSRIDIADHLGLSIETVSRCLTEFERKGIIGLPSKRRTIVLRDRAALRRLGA